MMTTHPTPMLDWPASRASDPDTSRIAERRLISSGGREKQCDQIANAMRFGRGAMTACEIAVTSDNIEDPVDRYAVSRRLPEMERAGIVVRCAPRLCRARGTKQTTWRLCL